MDRDTLLRRVMAQTGLDELEADKAMRAVLFVLADVVSRDEVHDMASQLPKEFRDLLMGRLGQAGPVQRMNWQAFVGRVQSDLGLDSFEKAERITLAVFSALKEAVSPGEMEDVLAELPVELKQPLLSA